MPTTIDQAAVESEENDDEGDVVRFAEEVASRTPHVTSFEDNESSNDEEDSRFGSRQSLRPKDNATGRGVGALEKQVGVMGGVAVMVGMMLGSGIFRVPVTVYANCGSVGMSFMAWMIGGTMSLVGALCYIELGTMIPKSGGEHAYLFTAFGSLFAFLFSWTKIMVTNATSFAIIALIFADYICAMFSGTDECASVWHRRLGAWGCILLSTLACTFSTKFATRIQSILFVIKTLSILFMTVAGVVVLAQNKSGHVFNDSFRGTEKNIGKIGTSIFAALFSFEGWNYLCYLTGEMTHPSRDLPRAVIFGNILVMSLYMCANIALFAAVPLEEWRDNPTIGLTFGAKVAGEAGRIGIALAIAISCLGATLSGFFGGARLIASTADVQQLPHVLASVSKRFETPIPALVFQAIITCMFTMLNDLEVLIEYFGIASWIFYFLTGVALLYMRWTHPDLERPFKVPIALPLLFCVLGLTLVITPIFENWLDLLGSVGAIALGVPIWLYQEGKYPVRIQSSLRKIVQAIPGVSSYAPLPTPSNYNHM